jgi:LAS superfamily LD-carboxypeptidase LdcB
LLPEAGKAFEEMQKEARKAGIELEIVSAYRSYERQQRIWNRKYTSNAKQGLSPEKNIQKIIEYSTLPGTSRHHWGTDVDLIDGSKPQNGDVLLTEKFHDQGPYAPMRKWMDENANKFGFIRPYTQDPKRKGFYYEPWHYSYAPLSIPMLNAYLKLDLNRLLIPESLEGSSSVTPEFLSRYITEHVLGIAPILK